MNRLGYCKFCGQSRMIGYTDDLTQDEIDVIATDGCSCEGARRETYCRHKARIARFMISQIVDPFSTDAGKAMRYLADAVARDRLHKVTIRINDRYVANMAAGDRIAVTVKETKIMTQEDVEDTGDDAREGLDEVEAVDE